MSYFLLDTIFGTLISRLFNVNFIKHPEDKDTFQLSQATSSWQHSFEQQPAASNQNPSIRETPNDLLHTRNNRDDAPDSAVLTSAPDDAPWKLSDGTEACHGFPGTGNGCSGEVIVVSWYTSDDPANPINWPKWKKLIVFVIINYTSFVVYMASAIYTPAQANIQKVFGVTATISSLGLGLYLLGYGTGSLVFAPISEVPSIGRNAPYVVTLFIFLIISVPTALSSTFETMMILRFFQGFFGSPILSAGGASLSDISDVYHRPFALYTWAVFSFAGPSVGSILAGYTIPHLGWRWSLWEIMIFVGPAAVLHLFLPETSAETILYRRAIRIRHLTADSRYRTQSEIQAIDITAGDRLYQFLIMPWRINALNPSILFTSIYTGLIYAIFNSMFEFFPLVYGPLYGMNGGQTGLVLLCNIIAIILAAVPYFIYVSLGVNAPSRAGKQLSPEDRLLPALVASVFIPAGIFLFGWTSSPHIHWIVPTIGIVFSTGSFAIILQCIFVYIGLSYPHHAASLFAGNSFAKAVVAFGGVLWAHPLYESLGLQKGMSLLGALCAVCVSGIFILYAFGERLRKKSRFAI